MNSGHIDTVSDVASALIWLRAAEPDPNGDVRAAAAAADYDALKPRVIAALVAWASREPSGDNTKLVDVINVVFGNKRIATYSFTEASHWLDGFIIGWHGAIYHDEQVLEEASDDRT